MMYASDIPEDKDTPSADRESIINNADGESETSTLTETETSGDAEGVQVGTAPQVADVVKENGSSPDSTVESVGERNRQESTCSDDTAVLSKKDLIEQRDQPIIEDESPRSPIPLLPGEVLRRRGVGAYGDIIMLTSFRLFVTYSKCFVNIPLRLIESVNSKDVSTVEVFCKDGTVRSCKLATAEIRFRWLHAIKSELAHVKAFVEYFAVAFGITSRTEKSAPWEFDHESPYKLGSELRRLGFDLKTDWRITTINEKYECCRSYPRENVVPRDFDDECLEKVAQFRASHRFQSVVWRHRDSGAVLLRSSQPEVGIFASRSAEDEDLFQSVIKVCGCKSEKMLIVDARSFSSAYANRAKGGGFEYHNYYTNCDIEFMNLPNIHTVRTSFHNLRMLIAADDSASWHSSLESSNWILNLSNLLSSSQRVAEALTSRPVLVHCSDGWDRTPQLASLAQLILDPYYRTYKGFQVLIIKEWLQFGHKFLDRCGHLDSASVECCPVFLQWLDAVYQLTRQLPTAFEFNEAYLIKLAHHTYSCMFGTFLHNTQKEREAEELFPETVSVWSLIDALQTELTNSLYTPGAHKTLDISSHCRDLALWTRVYSPPTSHASAETQEEGLTRSQSYTDISASNEAISHPVARRLSDPDLSSINNVSEEGASNLTSRNSSTAINANCDDFGTSPSFVKLYNEERSRNNSGASIDVGRRDTNSVQKNGGADEETAEVIQYVKYLDIDGLTSNVDLERQKMNEIISGYKKQVADLKKQIQSLQEQPSRSVLRSNQALLMPQEKMDSGDCGPGSAGSNSDQSDSSWETVSTREPTVTLWIPDHAVSHCSACNDPFSLVRRKHHCRQCGQVYCSKCASGYVPIPSQQLFDPVRVCDICFKNLSATHENLLLEAVDDGGKSLASDVVSNGSDSRISDTSDGATNSESARPDAAVLPSSQPIPMSSTRRPPPLVSNMSGSPIWNNPTLSDTGPRKTCSQASINAESSMEGKLLMGAQV